MARLQNARFATWPNIRRRQRCLVLFLEGARQTILCHVTALLWPWLRFLGKSRTTSCNCTRSQHTSALLRKPRKGRHSAKTYTPPSAPHNTLQLLCECGRIDQERCGKPSGASWHAQAQQLPPEVPQLGMAVPAPSCHLPACLPCSSRPR
eukprot:4913920-Amphidinium_carterae.1